MSTIRELEITQDESGNFYFIILEEGKRVMTSDPYEDCHECAEIGMSMLDEMHKQDPVRSDDMPRHVIGLPRGKHDQNE